MDNKSLRFFFVDFQRQDVRADEYVFNDCDKYSLNRN